MLIFYTEDTAQTFQCGGLETMQGGWRALISGIFAHRCTILKEQLFLDYFKEGNKSRQQVQQMAFTSLNFSMFFT